MRGKSTICPSISSLSNRVRKLTLAAANFPVLEHHQPTSCIWRFSLSAPPLHLKILQRRSRKVALKRTDHRQLHPASFPRLPQKKKILDGVPFTPKKMIPKNFQWEILKPLRIHPSKCSPNKHSPGLLRFIDGSLKAFTEPLLLRSVWQSFGSPSTGEEDTTKSLQVNQRRRWFYNHFILFIARFLFGQTRDEPFPPMISMLFFEIDSRRRIDM